MILGSNIYHLAQERKMKRLCNDNMFKKKRILLVEDSPLTSLIIGEFLHKHGYETETVATGEEAVKIAYSCLPPDLILMDIELDGEMDGIDAAQRILNLRNIPIIFLTANTSLEILEKIKYVRGYGVAAKGTDKYVLLSTIDLALQYYESSSYATLYRQIIENSLNEIYIFNPETLKFIMVNRGARENLGYNMSELTEMTPIDITSEFTIENLRNFIEPLTQMKQEKIKFNTVNRRKDGTCYPVEVHLQQYKHSEQNVYAAIIFDLTERRKMLENLQSSKEQLRMMLEGIPSPSYLITRERRILALNGAAKARGASAGDYCWHSIHGMNAVSPAEREAYETTGIPLPGTKCRFCLADKAMERKSSENCEVVLDGVVWNTWWIPVDEDIYLHYTVDVTKYKKMEQQLYKLSITDPLTNVYNRRHFIHMIEQEIERSGRTGLPFSIIMIDIDHFKKVNDRFGHAAGDQVLKNLVDLIEQRIRKTDCLARWGGEEFILLLSDTPVENAAILAEDMRERLSQMNNPGVGRVTASFGAAGYCPGETVDTLVQRADSLLYDAKAAGRNCVRYINECV